jgi:hypothetical protein
MCSFSRSVDNADTIDPGTLVYTDEYVRREAQGKNVEMTLAGVKK